MNLMEIFQQNPYVIIAICVVSISSLLYNFIRIKRQNVSNKNFLAEHPDAAKIYLTAKAIIASEAVQIFTVNDDHPETFYEGSKSGFYLLPGQSTVEISYSYSRPGILYKNVTQSTGVVKKTLEVEAGKSYMLGFDREEENFTFEEM